jgi:iron-sulfur cluster repair protein YtfE (RIC family)
MDIHSVRETLLAQHRKLREKIAILMAVSAPPTTDQPGAELDFRLQLAELSDELARHNRDEERLLSALVPQAASAGGRGSLMNIHHQREHAAQLGALKSVVDCTSFGSSIVLAQGSLREILDHMAREEREVLPADLLHEGAFTPDEDA